MKKIILFTLLFVCMFFLVYGAEIPDIIYVNVVNPNISATFNETVNLTYFNFTVAATGENIGLHYTTTDSKTFVFNPVQQLVNGFYNFVVNALDRIDNAREFKQKIVVNVSRTDIRFKDPKHGFSTKTPFNITIGTSRNATCRWSYDTDNYSLMALNSFDLTGTTDHKINNYNQLSAPGETNIWVSCLDNLNITVKKRLTLGYDPSAPVLTASVSNNPVIAFPPNTTITVNPNNIDDKIICYINGELFSGQSVDDELTYLYSPSQKITYPSSTSSNGVYPYTITCRNLAELSSSIPQLKINVSLQDRLTIYVVQPSQFVKNPLKYLINTNKDAKCTATLDGANVTNMDPISSTKIHSIVYGSVREGTHLIKFDCMGGIETAKTNATSFTVDDSSPSAPIINAYACSKDKATLELSAVDNQSGIAGYNYSISGTNVSVNGSTSNNKTDVSGLKLAANITYSVQAAAINKAGGVSASSSASFVFNPNITIACQEKDPPTITFNITETVNGKKVILVCHDASGCVESSIKWGFNNCSILDHSGFDIGTLQSTTTICYEAQDIYGNKATGSRLIELNRTFGAVCSDSILSGSETDVDCGGECLRCMNGKKCINNSDCIDNYCLNKICTRPLCTDQIKNGFETSIDCGGKACAGCAIGYNCSLNSDCGSNYCNAQYKCDKTFCNDTIKNGFETAVDCGGKDCAPCADGSSCLNSSDCKSGKCDFYTCVKGKETFEEWLKKYNITSTDKNTDSDKDGLGNYQEYLLGTNPNKADTDGDGYSDYAEYKAGTDPLDKLDFPVSNFYDYVLLLISLLILATGVVFLYYFKIDKQASMNITIIGGVALLFVLLDLLLLHLPKFVIILFILLALGGSGYFIYDKRAVVIPRLTGKTPKTQQGMQRTSGSTIQITKNEFGRPIVRKEELAATKQMIDMIRKEKTERERKRQELFGSFGKGKPTKLIKEEKPVLQKIKAKEIKKEEKPAIKSKSDFERLADITKGTGVDRLSQFAKDKVGDVFDKLTGVTKSAREDIFKKLPTSKKNIEDLSKLERKKKK